MTTTPNDPYSPQATRSDQPGYPPAYQENYPAPPALPMPPPASAGTNTMAILALIFAFVFSPLGVIFGFIGRSQIKRTGQRGRGLATAGIVLGLLFIVAGIALAVVVLVLAKNVVPTVSKDQVEQQISTKAAEQSGVTPDSVVCAKDLAGVVGATVTCTMTVSGAPVPVTATVTSVTNGVATFDVSGG